MLSLLIAASIASPSQLKVYVYGVGRESCARAFLPSRSTEREAWVMGYWSGLNTAAQSMAGHDTEIDGILAEVKLRCNRRPATELMQAVLDVWGAMR